MGSFHVYEDAGEVLFVQMRMSENGESVLWTTDNEGGTTKTYDHGALWGLQEICTSAKFLIVCQVLIYTGSIRLNISST
jgi:hypothetical protein